jgi:hypothetical protein
VAKVSSDWRELACRTIAASFLQKKCRSRPAACEYEEKVLLSKKMSECDGNGRSR